jgi:hypothetical protein
VWVEVGVALVSNPLSKRYSGYEVREVGVVQQLYSLAEAPILGRRREIQSSVRMKLRLAYSHLPHPML